MTPQYLITLGDRSSEKGIFADYAAKFGINQLVAKVVFAESTNLSEEDFVYHLTELLMKD